MSKKQIFWIILVVVVIAVLLCLHYFPLWVSGVTVLSFAAGLVGGWVGKLFYDKYIIKPEP